MTIIVAVEEASIAGQIPVWVDVCAVALGSVVGALVAARERFDISGVLFVAITSGLGGGILRDVILQRGTPIVLTSPWLLPTAVVVGAATFLFNQTFHAVHDRLGFGFIALNGAFLAIYTAVGTARGLDAGLPAASCVLLGTITGVGGGLLRDVLVNEQPSVLRPGHLEGLAAVAGASVQVAINGRGDLPVAAAVIGIVVVLALRLLSVWRGWETPPAPTTPWRERRKPPPD